MGGKKTTSSSSTQNIDRRIGIDTGGGQSDLVVAEQGASVTVQRLDAGLVEEALKSITNTTNTALLTSQQTAKGALETGEFFLESSLATIEREQSGARETIEEINRTSAEQVQAILKEENRADQAAVLDVVKITAGVIVVVMIGGIVLLRRKKN